MAKMNYVTYYGIFEFFMRSFGLANALAIFYTLMNHVFHDYLDKYVIVYLDDIVVFSSLLKDYVAYFKLVFEILRQH